MANSPNSIEMQIDNFLEQFKRSASKAMDGDWTNSLSTTPPTPTAGMQHTNNINDIHIITTSFMNTKNQNNLFDFSLENIGKINFFSFVSFYKTF